MALSKKKKGSQTKEIILISFLLILILGVIGGAAWMYFGNKKAELDKTTFCPIVNGEPTPSATLTILLDETDPLSSLQQDFVMVAIENMVREVEPGTLISIYTLSSTGEITRKPVFERCKIRDGSDADPLTENEKLLNKRFINNFRAPLASIMSSLTSSSEKGKESKIIEQIQSCAINTFQKWHPEGEQTLVIFSDMLQNSQGFSMYKNRNYKFADFKKLPFAAEAKTNLLGVNVEIYYFITNARLQRNSNVEFWKDFFRSAGARVNRVEPVGK